MTGFLFTLFLLVYIVMDKDRHVKLVSWKEKQIQSLSTHIRVHTHKHIYIYTLSNILTCIHTYMHASVCMRNMYSMIIRRTSIKVNKHAIKFHPRVEWPRDRDKSLWIMDHPNRPKKEGYNYKTIEYLISNHSNFPFVRKSELGSWYQERKKRKKARESGDN